MENHEKRPLPEARTSTVEDIAAMLNIGRTSAYTLVNEYSGRFYTPIPEIGNHRSDMKETAIPF